MKKTLPFDKAKILEIEKNFPTPFYVYDEKGIANCVTKLYEAFSWNEGYKEYFAVKALPNPSILKLLKSLNCGIDCASETELMMGEKLGLTGENIMFSSNETPLSDYVKAKQLGAIFNLDDISHIEFIDKNLGLPELVCLRYNSGNSFMGLNDIMGTLHQSKFGMTRQQILDSVKLLLEKGVKRFGLHAMLSSSNLEQSYYPALAREMFELALELKNLYGVKLEFVNLSGGIGIPYTEEENEIDIMDIGANVKKVYDELISANDMKLKIFTELGRYITGPYGSLVTTVLHKKESFKHYVGVDATACNLMRPALYGSYHHITVLGKEEAAPSTIYDVVGSLCENNDKFAIDRMLPEIEIGDIIVLHDAGAHGYSMGYNYNGKLRCAELMLCENGDVKLIRRAETPQDYFSTLDIYDEFK